MKLGVFMVLFGDRKLEDALDYVVSKGLKAVEIGTGGYPGNSHCEPKQLLEDEVALSEFKQQIESRGLIMCGGPSRQSEESWKSFKHYNEFIV